MKVCELIKYLEDCDPELPVYVSSSDHDYDWMTLHPEHISTSYITDLSDDEDESIEIKAICLGDGHQ